MRTKAWIASIGLALALTLTLTRALSWAIYGKVSHSEDSSLAASKKQSAPLQDLSPAGAPLPPARSLTSEERKAVLAKFSGPVRELQRQVEQEYSAYQGEYSDYLKARERLVHSLSQNGATEEARLLSELLDVELQKLKHRSELIARRSGELNQAILSEYL